LINLIIKFLLELIHVLHSLFVLRPFFLRDECIATWNPGPCAIIIFQVELRYLLALNGLLDLLVVGFLAQLAAFWDHTTSARFPFVGANLSNSLDDLLRKRLSIVVGTHELDLVVVFLASFISDIGDLFIILFTLLLDLLEDVLIFENIFDVQNFAAGHIHALILDF
jgi:hypothetical protein